MQSIFQCTIEISGINPSIWHHCIRPRDEKAECGVVYLRVTPPQKGAHEQVSGQDNAYCFVFMSAVSSILSSYHKGRLWILLSTWKFSRYWKEASLVSGATSNARASCTITTPLATTLSSSATTWPGMPQWSPSLHIDVVLAYFFFVSLTKKKPLKASIGETIENIQPHVITVPKCCVHITQYHFFWFCNNHTC